MKNYNSQIPDLCDSDLATLRKSVRDNTEIARCYQCFRTFRFQVNEAKVYFCDRCLGQVSK